MITNKKILDVVEKILGKEIMSNPVQNTRIKQPEKKLPEDRGVLIKGRLLRFELRLESDSHKDIYMFVHSGAKRDKN